MQITQFPDPSQWGRLLSRPVLDTTSLAGTVRGVFDDVRARGDAALREATLKYDKVELGSLCLDEEQIEAQARRVPQELREAILTAVANITLFHKSQDVALPRVETMPGVTCWQRAVAIDRVGLYVPGGQAPLFSTVLMLAIPAKIAGCTDIVMCTPPGPDGHIADAMCFAAQAAGVTRLFTVGGVQAIAAMSLGTESVPRVYKLFGPGNQYVTAAKQYAQQLGVSIDLPAGPSEVLVIADDSGNPSFIAADLLSQAEHGPDSQAILITSAPDLAMRVSEEVDRQLECLDRASVARQSIAHSRIVVVRDLQQVVDITNEYAPEHLIIETDQPELIADQITNAGSLFLGHLTPEAAGDYASGTNHTLPTLGYAHAYNGVNLDSFRKKMTVQRITAEGVGNISRAVELMAHAEHLTAHERAMSLRRESLDA